MKTVIDNSNPTVGELEDGPEVTALELAFARLSIERLEARIEELENDLACSSLQLATYEQQLSAGLTD